MIKGRFYFIFLFVLGSCAHMAIDEDKIDQFCALMDPLGLVEVSRTGVLSIKRGAEKG